MKSNEAHRKLLFWRVVAVCSALAFLLSLIVIFRLYSVNSTTTARLPESSLDGIFVVDVTRTDTTRGKPGQYFNFETNIFDELYGANGWEGAKFLALNRRTAKLRNIIVWRINPRDVTTLGFGKQLEDSQGGDWKTGDKLIIVTRSTEP